jgi:hypothetical protein
VLGRRGFLSSCVDREEISVPRSEELFGDSPLARHDRHGCERSLAAAVPVEVAGDPRRVDVELDGAHNLRAEQRIGDSRAVTCSPPAEIRLLAAVIPSAERAGSITPPSLALQQLRQSSVDAALPWSISRVRFWRTGTTWCPGRRATPNARSRYRWFPSALVTIDPKPPGVAPLRGRGT